MKKMTRISKKPSTKRRSSSPRRRSSPQSSSPQRTSLKNRTTHNPQTGVLHIIPKTRGFKVLSGDVNWKEYGCTWYRSLGDGTYYILEFINFEDATGSLYNGNKYCVRGSSIDLSPGGWSHDKISAALKCIGSPKTRNPQVILDAIYCYSGGDMEFQIFGNNANELLAEGKRRL
jgi:hypothetical protein